ncbi:MAG TPA: hypothetical protein VEQ15_07600 [Myxococcales bacterium]|nr:hypothetical protein [Myxococcales bacterium]
MTEARNRKRRYAVVLAEQMAEIPADTIHQLRLSLQEIGEACEVVPPSSPFWFSVAGSDLVLDVAAWRFVYSIDRAAKKITVKGHKPLR